MKMYFYRGDNPNFGDELNHWLLPRLFGDFFDDDDSTRFLGIGSILYDHHPAQSLKIVFGSGWGGYTPPPVIDDRWKVYCVRGPRTADALGLAREKVAGDAAILVRRFRAPGPPKTIKASFMPHWESIPRGHWETACRIAGVHFINPHDPVEQVMDEIEASEVLLTEAMHGAIVADALRVPWIPVLPFEAHHRMKWLDWAEALDVSVSHQVAWPSSLREAWMLRMQRRGKVLDRLPHLATQALDWGFVRTAALRLATLVKRPPTLSTDAALDRASERLEDSVRQILSDHQPRQSSRGD